MTSDTKLALIAGGAVAAIVALDYWSSTSTANGGSSSLAPFSSIGAFGSDASEAILSAISSFENVAYQHNNPGGICGSFDSAGNCLGPATFDSYEAGAQAAVSKISSWIAANPAMSVAQFVEKWSGAAGATLQDYIAHVSDELGLDPTDPISAAEGVSDGLSLDDDSGSDGSAGFDSSDGVNF
jgi:hypothetical protein